MSALLDEWPAEMVAPEVEEPGLVTSDEPLAGLVQLTANAPDDDEDESEASVEELEAALVASAQAGRGEDRDGLAAWLRQLDVKPGKYPSIPAADAYALYHHHAESTGAVPLAPYAFSRAMLARLGKKTAWYRRADGRAIAISCYCTSKQTARRLRALALEFPPGPDGLARFSFTELKTARAPARRRFMPAESAQ